MRNRKPLPAVLGAIAALGVAYVAINFIFIDFFVDLWWFRSLDLEAYFWLKFLYRFIFSGVVTLFFFIVFWFHFWVASRYLGFTPPDELLLDDAQRQRFQRIANLFITGSSSIYLPISLFLAIIIAIPFYQNWEQALLFFFGGEAGVKEPLYGNDAGFYMFQYPIYQLIQQELLISAIVVLAATGLLYWLEHKILPGQTQELPLGAKVHLSILFVFVMLFVVWGLMLRRFGLLYDDGNLPVFYGPGFKELRYSLPMIWLAIVMAVGFAAAVIFYVFSHRHRNIHPVLISLGGFLAALWLEHLPLIPNALENFIVKPNYTRIEADAMENNIQATLSAYGLADVKTMDFHVELDPTKDIEAWSTQRHFENIPVWDRDIVSDSYKQLQGIRPYYDFPTVDEDRYFINNHLQQVNLAAREINIDKLPKEAQNWENSHLRYTHGYGAVISPAAQDAGIPIVWYLRDLNMNSDVGFSVKYPDIYYGKNKYSYALSPNRLISEEISGSAADGLNYLGDGGIPIKSYFRKLLLATYLKDKNIFLSPNITQDSRLLIRRNIQERIETIAPFLSLDQDPYLVAGKERFYWMQDAYTLSNFYPLSKPTEPGETEHLRQFNYIRNSIKVVVDAYDGRVDFYITDPNDPIAAAYQRAYPGLFKPVSEMPRELKQHLRYPRDLFYIQMNIYAKYHQNTAPLFYEQAETWEFAKVNGKTVLPYFITQDFNHCNDKEEFVMINPMTPIHRENLSVVAVASAFDVDGCDDGNYKPGITVFKFPKAVQVNGPSQVNALIDQKPEIAAQFTLWNQQGSEIRKGRMIILPMDNSILYVQPIYTLATHTKMPELARVIVSIGNEVVMEKTLREAFGKLKTIFIRNAQAPSSGISGSQTP